MGWPRVVILTDSSKGSTLFRYTVDGQFAGDTWHESPEFAREQAEFEYGKALGPWQAIPPAVPDAEEVQFALRRLGDAKRTD